MNLIIDEIFISAETKEKEWDDLVLNNYTSSQIRELESWVKYNDTLIYD